MWVVVDYGILIPGTQTEYRGFMESGPYASHCKTSVSFLREIREYIHQDWMKKNPFPRIDVWNVTIYNIQFCEIK